MAVIPCPKCGAKNRVDSVVSPRRVAKCGKCGTQLPVGPSAEDDSKPIVATDRTFDQILTESGSTPLLIDCWAPWCGPCQMIGPIMEQLAQEAGGRYRIGKLNVDENPQTAARFQIASIPTMLLFKEHQLRDRLIGAHPKATIAARLAQIK